MLRRHRPLNAAHAAALVFRNMFSYFDQQRESRMRSAGRPRNKAAWFSAPAAMQGRRATVCQADQHLREFWQCSAAVAPVIEPSGDARKQGCRARSAGGGIRGRPWQGRDGGREPGRSSDGSGTRPVCILFSVKFPSRKVTNHPTGSPKLR